MKKNPYNGYNDRPHKCPAPEDMPDELMTFTYNPNFTPFDGVIMDMATYSNELVDVFKLLKYCEIKLVHEISSSGKWHLHGYIKIINKMKFVLFDFKILKEHGVFEIDTIADPDKWKEYVYKQKSLMTDLLKEYKIPYSYNTMDDKLYIVKVDPLVKMKKCKKEEPDSLPSWMPPPDSS